MSHYVKITTQYRDPGELEKSLRAKFPNAVVEVFDKPTIINGWNGTKGEACSLVVRNCEALPVSDGGPRYADLGFKREADGTYSVQTDHMEEPDMMRGLAQDYARRVAIAKAKASGFTVTEQKAQDGTITLNLTKWR